MAQTPSIDVVALTQTLVRIPSPSGGEANVAAFVHRLMVDLGFDAVEVDAWGNVVGVLRGAQPGPILLFDAHMDVVDVGPQPWRCDPFGGEVADGRLYGRGAADTKGSLAAMLCTATTLPRGQLRGALVVAATVCEENLTGAALGHVLDRYPADVVITGEPTGLRLGVAQKGRATIRLYAEGRSAHTSQPELGENAVYKMIEAVQRLRHLPRPVDQELGPAILELVELASEPLPNQTLVPAGCAARFVARTLPGQTAEGLLHEWQAALSDLPGVSVAIETLRQRCYTGALLEAVDFLPPWRLASDHPWRGHLLDALHTAGLPADIYAAPCGTNASESAGRRNIPSFIFGPGLLAQAHIVDEWVTQHDLYQAQAGYAALATRFLTLNKASS